MDKNKKIVFHKPGRYYVSFELYDDGGDISVTTSIDDFKGGWMWTGNESSFLTFINRIYDSILASEFKEKWKKEGLDKYINNLINIAIDNNDFYSILGDNAFWFDNGWLYDYVKELLNEEEIDEKEYDYYFDNIPLSYEELAPYIAKDDYIENIISKLRSIKSIDEFYNLRKRFSMDAVVSVVYELISDKFYSLLNLSK